jgi:hypothetical protein
MGIATCVIGTACPIEFLFPVQTRNPPTPSTQIMNLEKLSPSGWGVTSEFMNLLKGGVLYCFICCHFESLERQLKQLNDGCTGCHPHKVVRKND